MLKVLVTAIWLTIISVFPFSRIGLEKTGWSIGQLFLALTPYIVTIWCISFRKRKQLSANLEIARASLDVARNRLYVEFPQLKSQTRPEKSSESHTGVLVHAVDKIGEHLIGKGHVGKIAAASVAAIGLGAKHLMKPKRQRQLESPPVS